MTGCLGCLGLVVVLALVAWPIEELQHLLGWSDSETGSVGLVWFGLFLVGASVRRRRSARRGSRATAGRVRGDEQRRADAVSIGQTLQAPPARDRYLTRWRPEVGRPGGHPGGLCGTRCVRRLGCGRPTRSGRRARRSVARVRDPIPAKLRFNVLARDGFRCRYCGRTGREQGIVLHVDHVVPVAAGGAACEENLLTACAACNLGKGTRPLVPPLGFFGP